MGSWFDGTPYSGCNYNPNIAKTNAKNVKIDEEQYVHEYQGRLLVLPNRTRNRTPQMMLMLQRNIKFTHFTSHAGS
jgi:hypothetical protein